MTQNNDHNGLDQIDERLLQSLREHITEHLPVRDVNGEHVGTVDHLEGDRIKLTRASSADGEHHYVKLSDVRGADDVAVYLDKARGELQLG